MPRVSELSPQDIPEPASTLYATILRDYGPYQNVLSALAHRPPALEHIFGYLLQSKNDALISPRHLEIALLTASRAHACHYCVAHHQPRASQHGLSAETIEKILDPEVPGLNALDRLVRDYAILVIRDAARIPDRLHRDLREHYTEAQIVELTIRIALCSFFKRFDEALEIDVEDSLALEVDITRPAETLDA